MTDSLCLYRISAFDCKCEERNQVCAQCVLSVFSKEIAWTERLSLKTSFKDMK